MPEIIFIAKIFVSIFAVLTLSVIAENVSPKIAGILSGYPLGTAIALFFIGIENGANFAANSAIYTLSGFSASVVFVYFYYKASLIASSFNVYWPAFVAAVAFLLAAGVLSQFSLGLIGGFITSVTAIGYFSNKFKSIENTQMIGKVKLTHWVLLIRALAAAAIVLVITGLAKLFGSSVAGVLSAFPITLFPFLIIIHLTYGKEYAHTIIKNYPFGLGSLITYVISVSFTYPWHGVAVGTVLSFILATLYLLLFAYITNNKDKGSPGANENN